MPEPSRDPTKFRTLGQLALELGVPVHRLKYAIDQYRVVPICRVGITRVWGTDQIPAIRSALARVASNRGER